MDSSVDFLSSFARYGITVKTWVNRRTLVAFCDSSETWIILSDIKNVLE